MTSVWMFNKKARDVKLLLNERTNEHIKRQRKHLMYMKKKENCKIDRTCETQTEPMYLTREREKNRERERE